MALRPTGPGEPQVPAPRLRPASVPTSAPTTRPSATPRREPGYRLKTATSPDEIDRQIQRLMSLIANDNIDPDAPPGSYLNLLV
ncbi:hypothetical protein BAL199_01844 [alpha proteobacterium BAL199]|jgi:hypothetical protein|nr:hypothetical protein BAL199_01844 [alpha proteobacterium BAL199]